MRVLGQPRAYCRRHSSYRYPLACWWGQIRGTGLSPQESSRETTKGMKSMSEIPFLAIPTPAPTALDPLQPHLHNLPFPSTAMDSGLQPHPSRRAPRPRAERHGEVYIAASPRCLGTAEKCLLCALLMRVGNHKTWITVFLFTVPLEKSIKKKKNPPLFQLLHLKEIQRGLLRHANLFTQTRQRKMNSISFQISQLLDYKTTIKTRKIYNTEKALAGKTFTATVKD